MNIDWLKISTWATAFTLSLAAWIGLVVLAQHLSPKSSPLEISQGDTH